jgi:hypothetical protein
MSEVLLYVEIDISYCSLTYGVSPCTASLTSSPPTGTRKCFQSRGTCQDLPNYTDLDEPGDCPQVPTTLRFALDTDYLPTDIDCLPFIQRPEDVDVTPQTVSLGQDLGTRGSIRVTMRDSKHSDTGVGFDKYLSERDYDPFEQGTFWGKFRFRHPSLRGRALRLIRGVLGDEIEDMETRHYIIESTDGPTPAGYFSIIAKDTLKLADSDRSQAPAASNGFLQSDITSGALSLVLSEAGIGATYPASGYANIGGKEIVSFTRASDTLTIVRAQLNTEAVAHSAGDRVQVVYRAVGQDGVDIIWDWLVNYAGVSAGLINLSEWQAESASFIGNVYTVNVAEPTGVNTLISRLLKQMGAAVWQDEITQQIRFQVLRAIGTEADVYDGGNIKAGTLEAKEQPEKRVTRVQVYFGQVNPLKRHDELENYRSMVEVFDEEAEETFGGASIARILADGVAAGGRAVAERLGYAYLSRYVTAPRRFTLALARDAGTDPTLGGGYQLGGWMIQDDTGAETTTPITVTRIKPKAEEYVVEAEEMLFTEYAGAIVDPTQHTIIFDSDENNINIRTRHDELFPEPISGDTVTVYVNTSIKIGSTSSELVSLDWGSWPAGVTRVLINNGMIAGAGGRAGGLAFANDGQPGGTALKTTVAFSLENNGSIWGGGGGGGMGIGPGGSRVGGGGGGAGRVPGLGGGGTSEGQSGTFTTGGSPGIEVNCNGGYGGGPGVAGQNAAALAGGTAGSGGAAGNAIDGVAFVTFTVTGDIVGPQV